MPYYIVYKTTTESITLEATSYDDALNTADFRNPDYSDEEYDVEELSHRFSRNYSYTSKTEPEGIVVEEGTVQFQLKPIEIM